MNDVEKTLFLVGRVLVGSFFLLMGMNHFGDLAGMSATVADLGLPGAPVIVLVTGLLLVLAGISFIVGFHPLLGVLAAALFFVPTTLVMHAFWALDDPTARQAELFTFLRNVGMLGSVLVFLAIPRPWPLSVDRSLRRWRFERRLRLEEQEEQQEQDEHYEYDEQPVDELS